MLNSSLYALQPSINDPFNIDSKERIVFIGVSKWMSLIKLPQMHMYWAKDTRIPHVADFMTRNRYQQIKS